MKRAQTRHSSFELALKERKKGTTSAPLRCAGRLRADPGHVKALGLLAVLDLEAGRHRAAAEHLERAVRLEPRSAVYRCNLGLAYHRLGLLDKAREALAHAVKLDPNRTDALFNLALVLLEACLSWNDWRRRH